MNPSSYMRLSTYICLTIALLVVLLFTGTLNTLYWTTGTCFLVLNLIERFIQASCQRTYDNLETNLSGFVFFWWK